MQILIKIQHIAIKWNQTKEIYKFQIVIRLMTVFHAVESHQEDVYGMKMKRNVMEMGRIQKLIQHNSGLKAILNAQIILTFAQSFLKTPPFTKFLQISREKRKRKISPQHIIFVNMRWILIRTFDGKLMFIDICLESIQKQ